MKRRAHPDRDREADVQLPARRDDGTRLILDIVDPHDPGLEDAARKASGLARFAVTHGYLFGRIDLVAKIDGRLRRLHLADPATRDSVAVAATPNALKLLYPRA